MTGSSFLIEEDRSLVLDTSVLINLHASRCGERILQTIPNGFIVPEIVAQELENETSQENGEHGFLQGLIALGLVEIVAMTDEEREVFTDLVGRAPSLDDGEASTIAIASSRRLFPIIDERKGRSRAVLLTFEEPGWTLDLFLHPLVRAGLNSAELSQAVYRALREARMRIGEPRCDQVVELIGIERALECRSLPAYKPRYSEWQARLMAKLPDSF
ncbi:DNA-binding protein [Hyphomicrobium sp.]|uniref:DNA-binding protein n=1 Tax=Hyphomicrobium sp. TaxID=82 RepID=UPI001D7A2173|nr:DNA-binding protein [Hyphomicrobium sp.]MBY0558589.1 DNA-binding protein [Hyphomicrobium sp.]